MRSLLLILVVALVSACQSGDPMTLRFVGPKSADHQAAAAVLKKRLDAYGSADAPVVNNQVIQVSGKFQGLTPKALSRLGRRGQLSFHIVEDEMAMKRTGKKDLCAADLASLKKEIGSNIVPTYAWLPMAGKPCALLVAGAKLTEADIDDAEVEVGELGPQVKMSFTSSGRELFGALTRQIKGRRMAIVVDGAVAVAPVVQEEITGGRAVLNIGDLEESRAFARSLVSGRLPAHYRAEIVSTGK
jgi:preprotein translocase subunit SecD